MKVLVATDGSVNAEAAVEVLLYRPWPKDAQFRVVTVADKSPDFISKLFPYLGGSAKEIEQAWIEDCKEVAEETAKRLSEKFDKGRVSEQFKTGDPKDAILEEAQSWGADLLVIGAEEAGRTQDDSITRSMGLLIGTFTDFVVTNAPCSVSVLRAVSPDAMLKEMDNKQPIEEDKYLLPVDDSPHSKKMLDTVLSRPWPEKSFFKLITAIQPLDEKKFKRVSRVNPKQWSDAVKEKLKEDKATAQKFLDETGKRFEEAYPDASVTTEVVIGHPREVVLKLACEWPADHIILGSRKIKGLVNEVKMGAISKGILFHAPCSVEIVR